jgi:hypothetical protein
MRLARIPATDPASHQRPAARDTGSSERSRNPISIIAKSVNVDRSGRRKKPVRVMICAGA